MPKRKSLGGGRSMCVQPAFIIGTYDERGIPNFAPITWISVTWQTDRYLLVISMFGSKQTKRNIEARKMFSANLVSVDMLGLMDYFGSRSGENGVKSAISYEVGEGEALRVPTLGASRWVYECEVVKSVDTGDSRTYFCDIKNVQVDESVDISVGVDLTALDPVIYSGHYHSIGKCLGKIGDFFSRD